MKADKRYRMKNKTYIFHSDPGHGWLAVKKSELTELQIYGQITQYSYMKGDTVYLEEDCDAYTFIKRFEQIFGQKPKTRESYLENTPIRYYQNFRIEL
jgi:hypothetical protein